MFCVYRGELDINIEIANATDSNWIFLERKNLITQVQLDES